MDYNFKEVEKKWKKYWKDNETFKTDVTEMKKKCNNREYRVKTKAIIKLPEGNYSAAVESSRGEFGVMLESHGDKSPYRLHYRSTGLPLVHALDTVCKGNKIADLIAIGGTLDYVIPDIDR